MKNASRRAATSVSKYSGRRERIGRLRASGGGEELSVGIGNLKSGISNLGFEMTETLALPCPGAPEEGIFWRKPLKPALPHVR
jgi:hypothetical protein